MKINTDKHKTRYYAAVSKNKKTIDESSSGGLFYELCRRIIDIDGVVYGAVMDNSGSVSHARANSLEEVELMKKSKYTQSNLNNCFSKVKSDLENDKIVLFSGTPCQINGLKVYLKESFDKLITVEIVCHGMPLSKAYNKYIFEIEENIDSSIINIDFRDKTIGWEQNCIKETYENGYEEVFRSSYHPFHALYLKGINIQKRCGYCGFVGKKRVADISLADFWKYNGWIKDTNDNKGISLITINTKKGDKFFKAISNYILFDEVSEESVRESCKHFFQAPKVAKNQEAFDYFINRDEVSFKTAAELCDFFGDIVIEKKLCKYNTVDEKEIVRTFLNDPEEIIYIVDHDNKLQGIVTLGAFLNDYDTSKCISINRNFLYVNIRDRFITIKIKNIFDKADKIKRVPIIDSDGHILAEIRKYSGDREISDSRLMEYAFRKLISMGVRCYFFKRPDTLSDYRYTKQQKNRIEKNLTFEKLIEENTKESKKEIKEIIKKQCSDQYIDDLYNFTPIVKFGRKYRHIDVNTRLVNVINGHRVSGNERNNVLFNIHFFGRCGVFGYAVEDGETLPAYFNRIVADKNIGVINHGTRGAKNIFIINNIIESIYDGTIQSNDMVIVYCSFFGNLSAIKKLGVYVADTTESFHSSIIKNNKIDFFDKVGHMNSEGYQSIAEYIYNDIEADILNQVEHAKQKCTIAGIEMGEFLNDEQKAELDCYLMRIKDELDEISYPSKKIGAVVVNCNPFSYGHRFLIEEALKIVDTLFVFVVEEDKSMIPFKHRIAMVKNGLSDLKNVYVFPSGKFIISEYTLPDYFYRNMQKTAAIDMSLDVNIFGKYIAPELGIRYRFVGTERTDDDTYYYNEEMKSLMPQYGIKLVEIKRKKVGEKTISASDVRRIINENMELETKRNKLEKLIPPTTMKFLLENGYI